VIRGLAAIALVLAACSRGAVPGSPCGPGRAFTPWDAPPAGEHDGAEPATTSAGVMIGVYQKYLRRPSLPDEGCPFEPTCSVYAQGAMGAYGAAGLLLVFDRLLIREHPLAGINYQETCVDGRWRWRDPVP